MKCLLIFHVCVEGLPTEEIKIVLEKILSEWKNISQHLEDLARKIRLQEDINAFFKHLDELEKTIKTKEEWGKHTPFSECPQQSLPSLKDSCQVTTQPSRTWQISMSSPVFKEDAPCIMNFRLILLWLTFCEDVHLQRIMWSYFLFIARINRPP